MGGNAKREKKSVSEIHFIHLIQRRTRRLTTANRSRRQHCVTKMFDRAGGVVNLAKIFLSSGLITTKTLCSCGQKPTAAAVKGLSCITRELILCPVVKDFAVQQDEANRLGGKWIIRLKKGLASRCWENLILAMLGEQFMVGDEICGAVISVRNQVAE